MILESNFLHNMLYASKGKSRAVVLLVNRQTNKNYTKALTKNGCLLKVVLIDHWKQTITTLIVRVIFSNRFIITNLATIVKMMFNIISHTDRALWIAA